MCASGWHIGMGGDFHSKIFLTASRAASRPKRPVMQIQLPMIVRGRPWSTGSRSIPVVGSRRAS